MNTFTFTNDQLELLVELVATADDSDQEKLVILSRLSKVLSRKSRHIIGECGGPELGPQALLMNRDSKEKSYPVGGGIMTIQMPKFTHDGGIIFSPKEK